MLTPNLFRQEYPQFKDVGVYTDALINPYLTLAQVRLNASRWGALLDYGTSLFVAHYLTIKASRDLQRLAGGIAGLDIKGPLTSRTVDKVSNSWDSKAVSITDGGFWNLTTYGIEFLQLASEIGSGGLQL